MFRFKYAIHFGTKPLNGISINKQYLKNANLDY